MNVDEQKAIGSILREKREEAGVSQGQVAASLGFSQSQISKTENGQRKLTVVELFQFSTALGCDYQVLVQEMHQSVMELDAETGILREL